MDFLPWFISVERQHGGIYLVIPTEEYGFDWARAAIRSGVYDKVLERSGAQFLKVLLRREDGSMTTIALRERDDSRSFLQRLEDCYRRDSQD